MTTLLALLLILSQGQGAPARGNLMSASQIIVTTDAGAEQPPFQVVFTAADNVSFPREVLLFTNRNSAVRVPANLNGTYTVTTTPLPLGYFIKSMTVGSTDLQKTPLTIRSSDALEIRIGIGYSTVPATVRLSGRVVGVDPARAKVKKITLKSSRAPRGKDPQKFTSPVSVDGAFVFPQVAPGNYVLELDPNADNVPRRLGVGVDEMTGVEVPAFIPTFNVSGNLPNEKELRQLGLIPNGWTLGMIVPDRGAQLTDVNQPQGVRQIAVNPQGAVRVGYFMPVSQVNGSMGTDGAFKFKNVPAGTYRLSFTISMRTGSDTAAGQFVNTGITVTVNDQDVKLGRVQPKP